LAHGRAAKAARDKIEAPHMIAAVQIADRREILRIVADLQRDENKDRRFLDVTTKDEQKEGE
jgi:hypothetical protein